jgi:pimeloyl-ACP methyl ester carboxylesterase
MLPKIFFKWASALVIPVTAAGLIAYNAACSAATSVPAELRALPAQSVELVGFKKRKVAATYYPATAANSPKALIVLFHQAGADPSEYNEIVPRLLANGYSVLNVDQGGDGLFSGTLDGKPDIEAALAWATSKGAPVILWGSSYSASLVYLVASENPNKLAAVLAFSGGDYLDKGQVAAALGKLTVPIFATSAPNEVSEMQPLLAMAGSAVKVFFSPSGSGVHGSGSLSKRENPDGSEAYWQAVDAFLARVLTPKGV